LSLGDFFFGRPIIFTGCKNTYDHNYWIRGRIFPVIIFGTKEVNGRLLPDFREFEIDWHPMRD